jgi:hypothetical protein
MSREAIFPSMVQPLQLRMQRTEYQNHLVLNVAVIGTADIPPVVGCTSSQAFVMLGDVDCRAAPSERRTAGRDRCHNGMRNRVM